MKELQRLWAKLERAGKARPKQDPFYGKARRLAKKMGATVESEVASWPHRNIWVSVEPQREIDGNPWGDYMRAAENWQHAYELLAEFDSFEKSLEA
tara:strand:+ start:4314 stop:4601 length:288 start_codon:yes stop_codon:yes gene_type:complete